ncbi:MAG: hypothetical protein NVSMB31_12840 [Vulcanimicrobiaceae bacterium]
MTWLRRFLPWLFVAAVAANCWELATLTGLHWNGVTGMTLSPVSDPFQQQAASVSDPAFAAGFRAGDRVDVRELHRLNGFANRVPGIPYKLIAHRSASTIARTIVPVQAPLDTSEVVRLVAVFWSIGFALLIALRGAASRENTLLVAVFLSLALVSSLDRMVWPDTRLAFVFSWIISPIFWDAACIALVLYAQSFGERPALWRARLALIICAAIAVDLIRSPIYGSVIFLNPWTDPNSGLVNLFYWGGIFSWYQLLLGLLFVAITIPSARRDERQRLAWVIVSFTPYLAGVIAGNFFNGAPMGSVFYNGENAWRVVQNTSFFFIPAGLTYAALAKRMFDVGFAVNRATVFAGVSVVVVTTFVLVEWALGKWFENLSHATSLAVNAGLAVVLGLSIRFVHKKIDLTVDNVFFRRRHENETALRRFAREAGFFTDVDKLAQRACSTVLAHSEATTVEIVLAAEVDPNDAAIVAMRAWHEPVDLMDYETSLRGEIAFPMLAHGTFVGAVLCGPKRTGERYAPDEIDAIRELANGVGLATDNLKRDATNGATFAQISAMFTAISERLDRLAPHGAAPPSLSLMPTPSKDDQ